DGGVSWASVLATETTDVDFHPTDSGKVVASGYAGNAFYSIDGGVTWTAATGFAAGAFRRVEVAYARNSPTTVYAMEDINNGTLYKSTDGGATYAAVSIPAHLNGQGWYGNALWVDPTNANTLVIGGVDLWRSVNGGV